MTPCARYARIDLGGYRIAVFGAFVTEHAAVTAPGHARARPAMVVGDCLFGPGRAAGARDRERGEVAETWVPWQTAVACRASDRARHGCRTAQRESGEAEADDGGRKQPYSGSCHGRHGAFSLIVGDRRASTVPGQRDAVDRGGQGSRGWRLAGDRQEAASLSTSRRRYGPREVAKASVRWLGSR